MFTFAYYLCHVLFFQSNINVRSCIPLVLREQDRWILTEARGPCWRLPHGHTAAELCSLQGPVCEHWGHGGPWSHWIQGLSLAATIPQEGREGYPETCTSSPAPSFSWNCGISELPPAGQETHASVTAIESYVVWEGRVQTAHSAQFLFSSPCSPILGYVTGIGNS